MVMVVLTLLLFIIGYGLRDPGWINRFEGLFVIVCYVGYVTFLVTDAFGK